MNTIQWDIHDSHTFMQKHEKGKTLHPPCLIAAGMTATASVSGKQVDISITSVLEPCVYEGVVKWIDTRDRTPINIAVGDKVSIQFMNLIKVNQDIQEA